MSDRVNRSIGQNIRLYRRIKGMSQKSLGSRLGVSSQQIQKYERGVNKIAAERLYEIAEALEVPVPRFFEDMEKTASLSQGNEVREKSAEDDWDPASVAAAELLSCYYELPPPLRARILSLLREMAEAERLIKKERGAGEK